MNPNNLEEMLEKVCSALECSIRGFKVTQASVTAEDVMVICFQYEQEDEDVVYLLGSEWRKLGFFQCCDALIRRIHEGISDKTEHVVQ